MGVLAMVLGRAHGTLLGTTKPFETGGKSVHNLSVIGIPPAYTHPVRRHYIPNMPLLLASIWADSRYRRSSPRLFELWG
jgi:hypothetical protein